MKKSKYTVNHNNKAVDDDLFSIVEHASDYDRASWFGKMMWLFHWRFFFRNYGRHFKMSDIPKGRRIDGAVYIYHEFLKYWDAEVVRARKANRTPNLVYPIFHQYGLEVLWLGLFCFACHLAMIYQALFLEDLIGNFNELNADRLPEAKWQAKKNLIWACAGILLLSVFSTLTSNVFNFFSCIISLRVRVCLSEFIYRKSLRLSQAAFAKTSTGQIVNLLSTDMTRIDWFFTMIPFPFVGFTLFGWAIFKLWKYLSHYTLYGVLFLSLVVPIQSLIGGIYSRMRMRAAEFTDERIRLVDEFLNAIKIIKVYCWERPFAQKINEARKREIGIFKKSLYIYSVSIGLFASTTKVMVFIIMITFYSSGGKITETIAFLTLSTFNQCTFLITIFVPHFILCLSNFMISIKRISRFLSLDEKDDLRRVDYQSQSPSVKISSENGRGQNGHVKEGGVAKEFDLAINDMTACFSVIEGVENASFLDDARKARAEKEKTIKLFNVLKNINFACRPGELVIVVGPVGSGKTSLLQAILSELRIREGSIQVNGRLSYASQESWIFGGTIRENILFDSKFDQERYEEVIKVCALERDLTLFTDGDRTQIGERGIALSGGQKARINLARALYFDADIYLLDDPLSAVDAHVSKHIFKNAISDFLKQKTVILVTHQLSFLRLADRVLFLKDGEQVLYEHSKRAMRRLVDEPESEFARFIGDYSAQQQPLRNRRDSSRTITSSLQSITQALLPRKSSIMFETLDPIVYDEEEEQSQLKEIRKLEKEKRIQEEDDKVSFVYKAYLQYFAHGNIRFYGLFLFLGFASTQICASGCDFFLEIWTETVKVHEGPTNSINSTSSPALNEVQGNPFKRFLARMVVQYDVYFYSGLVLGYFVFSLIRIIVHSMFCMRASVAIHKSLFNRMVRAQMKFFYTNPVGIILNRFSRDCGIIDDQLVGSFYDFIEILINDLIIFFVMAFANVWLTIPFLTFIALVIAYRKFYIQSARVIETLEGVAKSPLIQHLTSTLNGLSTVRAFKSESKFVEKFNRYQNDHTAIYFMAISTKRWFIFVLDNLQMIFVAGSLFVLVLFAEHFNGSMIGLIVTYTLQFSGEFQWCIICWSNLETYLCSVDRIERIGKNLDPDSSTGESLCEPPLESAKDSKPASDWPQNGQIEFKDLTMRYFANEPAVLKNLNFTIRAGEKVGIVGRTGAGKSSILAALFRLTDYEGEIWIDGVRAKSIGLHDLRGKISIIPQEAVLFTGSMRSNLDPLDEYKDHELWNALRAVQLEQVVKELDGGLDAKVMDNGSNFSTGQKQLICLARAILKKNRILVLDEATANTDPANDELIQATIRSVFKSCTILTIAHRLNTIMDSDRILVMDAGECREFDTPYRLLQDSASIFSSMVDAYGEEQSKVLRKIAADSEHKK